MEELYRDFKDVAEVFIVYIREAHAADSSWPVAYAKELDIKDHTSYGERCTVAERLFEEKKLTIPCLIDGMDNAVGEKYKGWPDRIFLVRKDGRLAVAAERGPWGLGPGIEATRAWLEEFKGTGQEPPLPETASSPEEVETNQN